MAKEMMIVFIYDTSGCRKEEDDPAEAVMYFHPSWVSPTQRLALAGQLMGVHHFLSTSFSSPKLISLQGGKFVMKKFGQYVLAVGTDRNIQDWILERRANCLESILRFFHCDLETISQSFNNDRNKFTEKLYQMLETYLPILQYSANLFSNMPMIKLPKTASNVFLESMQILQYCQETSGILGGAMFFNNKVVATQLSAELTKQLVITDPYRIRAPADRIPTNFHLPVGVQLLRVYIQRRHSLELSEENPQKNNTSYIDTLARKSYNKKGSLPVSGMKRDTSRIFTVPEEGESENSIPFEPLKPKRPPTLPISLNFEKKEIKTKFQNPLTPSVCSTPLKDVNRVLHGTAVSICIANEELEVPQSPPKIEKNVDDIPDVVKEALRCKRLNKLRNTTRNKLEMTVKNKSLGRRVLSLSNLEEAPERLMLGLNYTYDSPDTENMKKSTRKKNFTTITDPCYPVFRQNGCPVSQTLYDHYIATSYQALVKDQALNFSITRQYNFDYVKPQIEVKNGIEEGDKFNGFDSVVSPDMSDIPANPLDVRLDGKKRQETYRRSMSLPLKSLNAPAGSEDRRKSTECVSFDIPQRKKLEGLQLTPLMSKLSLLATDEKTSGFCSKDTTPSEFCDLSTFSSRVTKNNKSENLGRTYGVGDDDDEDFWLNEKDPISKEGCSLEKAELFICGQHSMVMVLLMEDGTANNPELIHNLWETCMNHLGRLESRLQNCLDPLPSTGNKELYSILSIDSQWDTLHRSGLWGVTELDIVSSLHRRFTQTSNLTDIIVRTEDTVVYGSQSGKTEIFYQQAMPPNTSGSLPTPADLMGVVPLKAKRRLERDHGIIIL